MWSLLSRQLQLTIVLAAGFLILRSIEAALALIGDEPLGFWRSVTLAATILGTGLVFAANKSWRWIWRQSAALQGATYPDLNGTWRGTLVSTWVGPQSGSALPPIPATITIRQTLFTTSVSLRTAESESHSKLVTLERLPEINRFRLWYTYLNGPQARVQHRSAPHEGVAYLELDWDGDREHLTGHYYTARRTTGDIAVSREP